MLNVFKTEKEVLFALATYFVEIGKKAITKRNEFSVVLSGGQSPKKLFELLTSSFKFSLDWDKVFFFFGDERYVPHTHPNSNFLLAKDRLFDPLNIKESNIFPVNTSLSPKEAAKEYEEKIIHFFKEDKSKFDLVILGLGDNSHTASIFPFTSLIHDQSPGVKAIFIEELKSYRISLNAPLINKAQHIAFLVFGESKAQAVHHILEDKMDIEKYPAQLIKPISGNLQWFLDKSAAALLKS